MRALARRLAARAPAGRSAGRHWRWAHWARVLAGRFRRAARVAERLVLTFGRGPALGSPGLVERIVERVRFGAAPALRLTVQPRLVLAGLDAARPGLLHAPRPSGLGAGERTSSSAHAAVFAPAFLRPAAAGRPRLGRAERGAVATPIERLPALVRKRFESPALPAPAWKRFEAPALANGGAVVVERLAARRGRVESLPGRPAHRLLHRPPRPSAEAPLEASSPRRHGPAASARVPGGPASGPSFPGGGEIDRLTDQVVQRIDRRMAAWRERTGRAR